MTADTSLVRTETTFRSVADIMNARAAIIRFTIADIAHQHPAATENVMFAAKISARVTTQTAVSR